MAAIVSLQVGKPKQVAYKGKMIETGIYKQPVSKPVYLYVDHFDGDEQADLINHGGRDKAVCVYPYEHYAYWQKVLDKPLGIGSFGENVTIIGMTEETVCIGDIYQFGEAIVQISQPRQPCYKLAMKLERADMPVMVQETGFTGYYFRVIQEGVVEQASTVQLIERHPLERTVANANDIKYKAKDNIQGLHNILAIEALSDSWRESFERKLNKLRS